MYCRFVPETSRVKLPLAGHVPAPHPEEPESVTEPEPAASIACEPLSALPAVFVEPLLPLELGPPLEG